MAPILIYLSSAPTQHPGKQAVKCPVLPARLLGTNVTYRFGTHDVTNTLFSFGYGKRVRTRKQLGGQERNRSR